MTISRRLRFEILRRDEFTCQYCGAKPADGTELHVDHVIPVALGGEDKASNLVAACKDCNLGKSSVPADSPLVESVSGAAAMWAAKMTDKMTRIRATLQESESYCAWFNQAWSEWRRSDGTRLDLPDNWRQALDRWYRLDVPRELVESALTTAMTKGSSLNGGLASVFKYMAGIIWRTLDDIDRMQDIREPAVYTQREYKLRAEDFGLEEWHRGYEAGKDASRYSEDLVARFIDHDQGLVRNGA